MKFLIVVAFVAILAAVNAASLTTEQKAEAQKLVDHCKGEIKITDEEFAKLRSGESTDVSQDVKCFAHCVLEKAGIIKDGAAEGTAILEKFTPVVGGDKAKEIAELCSTEKGTDICDTAFKVHTCFIKNDGLIE